MADYAPAAGPESEADSLLHRIREEVALVVRLRGDRDYDGAQPLADLVTDLDRLLSGRQLAALPADWRGITPQPRGLTPSDAARIGTSRRVGGETWVVEPNPYLRTGE
jgi:hypothetical protein